MRTTPRPMKGKIFIGRIYDAIFFRIVKIILPILPFFVDLWLTTRWP